MSDPHRPPVRDHLPTTRLGGRTMVPRTPVPRPLSRRVLACVVIAALGTPALTLAATAPMPKPRDLAKLAAAKAAHAPSPTASTSPGELVQHTLVPWTEAPPAA